jgi:hypothetical protein
MPSLAWAGLREGLAPELSAYSPHQLRHHIFDLAGTVGELVQW